HHHHHQSQLLTPKPCIAIAKRASHIRQAHGSPPHPHESYCLNNLRRENGDKWSTNLLPANRVKPSDLLPPSVEVPLFFTSAFFSIPKSNLFYEKSRLVLEIFFLFS
ncbi:hypothetical protein BHE74_00059795, partial [Ensete ventricosum]